VNEEISRQKTLKLQVGQIALGLASSSCLEGVESEEVIKAKTAEYTWGADGNPSCLQLLGEMEGNLVVHAEMGTETQRGGALKRAVRPGPSTTGRALS